ncbi:beta family protein [Chloroflexota bacterium]
MPCNYVPILKAKEGELIALRNLTPKTKSNLMPLIELQPKDRPELFGRTLTQIRKGWPSELPFLLDVDKDYLIDATASATDALHSVSLELVTTGFLVVPVTGLRRPVLFNDMISDTISEIGTGICIRLQSPDWQDVSSLEDRISDYVQSLSLDLSQVDLVFDYESFLPSHLGTIITSAVTAISTITNVIDYRNLIIAATAFPSQPISQPYTIYRFPRSEFEAWSILVSLPDIRRKPIFGDYTTVYPVLPDIDFRYGIKVAPKIKYTTESEWLCLRWDAGDFANFRNVCNELVGLPEFCGSDYSWGDSRVDQCATTGGRTGNPREWVSIGVNHHLTLAATQCASHPAS